MLDHSILIISISAQLIAAIIAIKLISGNRRNFTLILIVSIIVLMLFKRVISWLYLIEEHPLEAADFSYKVIDMVISLALLVGVFAIRKKLNHIQSIAMLLRESEERYALAAAGARDGLWDWNVISDEVYLSPRWKIMLGYDDSEIANNSGSWFEMVHPDDLPSLKTSMFDNSSMRNPHFEQEYRIRTKRGGYRWMLCRGVVVYNEHGRVVRLAGSQTDITGRKMVEQRLRHNAYHDPLTGLPNRSHFINRLGRLMEKERRGNHEQVAVLFIDLDGFKNINDNWGHEIGDQFLIQCGQRLENCVRPGDMLARIGGDEFVVLLEDINGPADAVGVAERVLAELQYPQKITGEDMAVTASVGIAFNCPACRRPEDLIHNADTAMYTAKLNGKNHYAIHDSAVAHQRLIINKSQISLRDDINHRQESA